MTSAEYKTMVVAKFQDCVKFIRNKMNDYGTDTITIDCKQYDTGCSIRGMRDMIHIHYDDYVFSHHNNYSDFDNMEFVVLNWRRVKKEIANRYGISIVDKMIDNLIFRCKAYLVKNFKV